MQERRQFVRLSDRVPLAYRAPTEPQPSHSMTSDLSGGGVRFRPTQPLPPGTRLQMELRVPGLDRPIPFMAEVTWSQQSAVIASAQREESVEIGARIIEIAPADQEALVRRIQRCLQGSSGSRAAQQ